MAGEVWGVNLEKKPVPTSLQCCSGQHMQHQKPPVAKVSKVSDGAAVLLQGAPYQLAG